MTEPLSIKDLTCPTCTDSTCWLNGENVYYKKAYSSKLNKEHQRDIAEHRDTIMKKGCASHPLALQVLAQQVVAEMENRKLIAHNRVNTYIAMGSDEDWQGGKEDGFDEAIKLLKGDEP
jgi:hypothetical protein